jgi:hypothetical protein
MSKVIRGVSKGNLNRVDPLSNCLSSFRTGLITAETWPNEFPKVIQAWRGRREWLDPISNYWSSFSTGLNTAETWPNEAREACSTGPTSSTDLRMSDTTKSNMQNTMKQLLLFCGYIFQDWHETLLLKPLCTSILSMLLRPRTYWGLRLLVLSTYRAQREATWSCKQYVDVLESVLCWRGCWLLACVGFSFTDALTARLNNERKFRLRCKTAYMVPLMLIVSPA